MTERGMIFNAPMVRAILDGSKTQTRRIMKLQPHAGVRPSVFVKSGFEDAHGNELVCPFGQPGDRIWVRETFASGLSTKSTLAYRATHKREDLEDGFYDTIKWTPSIHMPRWASRITLEITDVRVERLNSISDTDANAEGVSADRLSPARYVFGSLWQSIYGADNPQSWQANPWVWVIEFRRVEGGAA